MHIETTRDKLIDGDIFYFACAPQYICELSIDVTGHKFEYAIGHEDGAPFEQVMPNAQLVVIVHNVHGERLADG